MSAKDYEISCGLGSAYISRKNKNINVISSDRKPITTGEILMLVDWLMDHVEKQEIVFRSMVEDGFEITITRKEIPCCKCKEESCNGRQPCPKKMINKRNKEGDKKDA